MKKSKDEAWDECTEVWDEYDVINKNEISDLSKIKKQKRKKKNKKIKIQITQKMQKELNKYRKEFGFKKKEIKPKYELEVLFG